MNRAIKKGWGQGPVVGQNLSEHEQTGAAAEQGEDPFSQGGLCGQLHLFPGYGPLPIQGKILEEKKEKILEHRAIGCVFFRYKGANVQV